MQLLTSDKDLAASANAIAITTAKKPSSVYLTKKLTAERLKKLDLFSDIDISDNVRLSEDTDEEFRPVWPKNKQNREVIFIGAPSGCGKSYQIANLITSYKEQYPDNEIYFLSFKKHDVAFEDHYEYMTQIPLYGLTNAIDPNNFEDCLFIFDDCLEMSDTIDPYEVLTEQELKTLKKSQVVRKLKDIRSVTEELIKQSIINITTLGRSKRISLVLTTHNLRSGNYISKQILPEITGLFVFAKNAAKLKDFLSIYQSHLDKKAINTILKELFNSHSYYSYLFINQINNRKSLVIGNKVVLYIDNATFEEEESSARGTRARRN